MPIEMLSFRVGMFEIVFALGMGGGGGEGADVKVMKNPAWE